MTDQPTTTTGPAAKPPKGRSPNYPGVSLPKAIEYVKKVYDEMQQYELPLASITAKMGFQKPTTGPASVTYAALKKYGLLEDHGKGDARIGKVSDLAAEILHPNSPNRQAAIQRAALTPTIHREWWNEHGLNVPPYESLEWRLVAPRGPWTANGLKDFLREYRETMTFAKLDPTATVARGTSDEQGGEDGDEQDADDNGANGRIEEPQQPDEKATRDRLRNPRKSGVKTYAIPVDADHDAVIELPTPMTPERWRNFQTFLTAMEGVIVDHTAGRSEASDDEA